MTNEDIAMWKDPLYRTDASEADGNPAGQIVLENIRGGMLAESLEGGTYGCCYGGTAMHTSAGCCP